MYAGNWTGGRLCVQMNNKQREMCLWWPTKNGVKTKHLHSLDILDIPIHSKTAHTHHTFPFRQSSLIVFYFECRTKTNRRIYTTSVLWTFSLCAAPSCRASHNDRIAIHTPQCEGFHMLMARAEPSVITIEQCTTAQCNFSFWSQNLNIHAI